MSHSNGTAPRTHTAPYRIHMKGQEYSTLYHDENQVQRKKKGAKPRQEEETEMQEYSTVYHGDRPSQTRRGAGKGPENPLNESVYDQIDQQTTGTGQGGRKHR